MSGQLPHDEKLRELYRALPADEPREGLDEAILAAVRAEARKVTGGRRSRMLARLRWSVSLATAAGVLLVLLVQKAQHPSTTGAVSPSAMPAAGVEGDGVTNEKLRNLGYLRDDSAASGKAEDEAEQLGGTYGARMESEKVPAPAAPAVATAEPAAKPAPRDLAPQGERRSADSASAAAAAPASSEPVPMDGDSFAAKVAPSADAPSAAPSIAARRQDTTSMLAATQPWPFGLRAGLEASEACVRVAAALHRDCRFDGDKAVVVLDRPAPVDRGLFASRSVLRLTLTAADGRLVGLELDLQRPGGGQESVNLPVAATR